MLVRRSALERIGPFDEALPTGGDEEDWLRRLRAGGGVVMYLATAGLDHRRAGDDARLRSLMRSAYRRGRNLRAYDRRRGAAPSLARELRVLAGCGWHTVRRGCPQGLVMGAHSAGRALEAVRPR
jgi:GT2 family glycosyltransferase